MEEMELINEIITTVLDDRTDLKVRIALSDDLYRDAVRVCENPEYKEYLRGIPQQMKGQIKKRNGLYILPRDLESRQFILVSADLREDGCSHYPVIASEVLRAKNTTIFCEKYCGGAFSQIAGHKYNRAFQIWNEFDARRTGHRLYLSLVLQQMGGYDMGEVTNLLQERELPERIQEINVLQTEKNSLALYQRVAAILGMFHVWETAYNIPIAPHMNTWCHTLYEALKRYGSIKVADFEALDSEIQQLWLQREF